MIFEIDTRFLLNNKITAHQFLLLKLAYEGETDLLKRYLKVTDKYDEIERDLIALYNNGLAKSWSGNATFRDIKPSDEFISKITYTGDPYDEFYALYPTKVLRPDGSYDYLRVDRDRCRKMYHNIVRKSKTTHDHIMDCLKLEIDDRVKTGNMGYFKRMHTWLSSESWKVFSERINAGVKVTGTSTGKEKHGETFE